MSFGSFLHVLASLFMIFGGVFPYVGQYKALNAARAERGRNKGLTEPTPMGFSHFVCLILLICMYEWFVVSAKSYRVL